VTSEKPRVGVSACLVGREVRYDGGHKLTDAVVRLGEVVELVSVCPEDEVGMGTPREPIHITRDGRLVGIDSGTDHTGAMDAWAERRLAGLADLDGYVLKARSPSCGLAGAASTGGRGMFAQRLTETYPELPVTEEDGLDERFVARVFDHWRRRTDTESPGASTTP
jgi:uncharacterized protein YbbK (DUF523 family)